jgi:WD40 repeat protein
MPGLQLAISPDSHWLVTDSDDGTARLWNLRLDELVDLACRTAGRNLAWEEWEQYFPGQAYQRTCRDLPPGEGAPGG